MERANPVWIILTLILLPACTASTTTPQSIWDRDHAIAYSYDVLVQQGYEHDFLYENADFVNVQFPNGDPGMFVTLGFTGVSRGYQFLYRLRSSQSVELVQLAQRRGITWGLKSLRDSEQEIAQADIEFVALFPPTGSQPRQVLKVTGAAHDGTGLWDDGYFELVEIMEDGFRVIFTGVETRMAWSNRETRRRYEFVDLDGDDIAEIVEDEEVCTYHREPDGRGTIRDLKCEASKETYRFNGTRYEPTSVKYILK